MAIPKNDTARQPGGDDNEAFETVIRYFNRPEHRLLPKHLRLHRAIHDAISWGDLAPETRLPPELDVARRLQVSLGTAQRALGQLVKDGLIRRRQGKGTFVAERQIPEEELWQLRFLQSRRDAQYMPMFATLRRLRSERSDGPWSETLGADPAGYVYIERLIHSDGEIRCLSRMYLPAGRFGAVLDGRLLKQVNQFNVKLLLRKEFGARTVGTEQVVRTITLGADEAAVLGRRAGEAAMQLEATGIDQNGVPITFHEIVIPQSNCMLDVTFTGVPGRARSYATFAPSAGLRASDDSPHR